MRVALPPINEDAVEVYWAWRRLYRIVAIGMISERAAKYHTTRLLRAQRNRINEHRIKKSK